MPKFDAAVVQQLIAESRINALSLDTQALREQNYNLSAPAMVALKQFNGTTVSLMLSDVVVGEIRTHVAEGAADAKKKLENALKDMSRKHFRGADDKTALSSFSEEPAAVADRIIEELKETFGFRIHPSKDHVEVSEVLRRYFASAPPFETRADKKSEFPDAIALLSLDAWATKWNAMLLLVSKDGGWKQFAEESTNLICVDDIPTALDLFNRSGHFIAERIIAAIQSGEAIDLIAGLQEALDEFIERLDAPECDFWSHMDVELDFVAVDLEDWQVDQSVGLRVLEEYQDEISFVFDVDLTIAVTGQFDFSVSDREDTMPMGSAERKVFHHQSVPVAVLVSKQELPDPAVLRIGVGSLKGRFVVRFGDLVPDDFYGSDEPNDEGQGSHSDKPDDGDLPF